MAAAPVKRRSPLHHTSLFQLREPAFWLYAVTLALTGLYTIGEQSLYRRISPSGWVLSWVLLLAYALPVFLIIYFLDLYEREPMSLLIGALLWGAVAATTMSGFGNSGWGEVVARVGGPEFAAKWTAALTAPFVEETLKGLGVVIIYLIAREEIDDVMDGFVYGATVGLGFAVVEDVYYFIAVFGGSPADVIKGYFIRVIASGLYSHVLYTGLVGMGIGYAVTRRGGVSSRRRGLVLAGLVSLAVFGHLLWNSPLLDFFPEYPWTGSDWLVIPLATAVKGLPLLAFAGLAVKLARGRERRWLNTALMAEAGDEGISAGELAVLESPKARRAVRAEMKARAGRGAADLLERLHREQVNLAMIRSRVAASDDPALIEQRAYCKALRDALQAIPGVASAEAVPPA